MSDSEHDSIDEDEGWDSESVSDDIPVTDIPLYERLQREEEKNQRAAQSHSNKPPKKLKKTSSNDRKNSTKEGHKKAHKNAPAELPSNKPVRRLRVDANNTTAKRRDPRFSDLSGRLDTDKFLHSYKFLDEYQEDEIKRLQKTIAKSKSAAVKEEAKQELVKYSHSAQYIDNYNAFCSVFRISSLVLVYSSILIFVQNEATDD